jgi:gas vesicle protein
LKTIADEMKATKDKIKELLKQNKELIKNKEYVHMDLVYDQIADIQLTRNEQLKTINDILVKMIEIV